MSTSGSVSETRIDDLLHVLAIARRLAEPTDLAELLDRITSAACEVLNCQRGTVFVHDSQSDELVSRVATGVSEIRIPSGAGIAGQCFARRETINLADAYTSPLFNPAIDRETGFKTESLLTCPLLGYDGSALGVVQVINKRDGSFTDWDQKLMETLAAQSAVAVQRQLLLEAYAHKQRLEGELDIARDIQRSLIPSGPPNVPGFEVAGWFKPADKTGGDFYDYFPLSDGRMALAIADVTGHGIGPALVVAECRALLRASLIQLPDVEQSITQVNRLLAADIPSDRFVTVFLGLLDPTIGELLYVSAGHGPVLHFKSATGTCTELPTHGLPLGVAPDIPFDESNQLQFSSGDLLVMLTDGMFEWENAAGEPFGTERICDCVSRHRDDAPAKIIEQLYRELQAFVCGTPQRDDLTALVVKQVES